MNTNPQAHPDRKAAAANLAAASRLELCVDVEREWNITLEFLHLASLRSQHHTCGVPCDAQSCKSSRRLGKVGIDVLGRCGAAHQQHV